MRRSDILRDACLRTLVGTILGCHFFFLSEILIPLPLPVLAKSLAITLLFPAAAVSSRWWLGARASTGGRSRPLLAAATFGLWSLGYFLAGHLSAGRQMHSLALPLDGALPFRPEFVLIYVTVYPMFLLPLFAASRRLARDAMGAYIAILVVSYAIFVLYPVSVPRPELAVTDFTSWALASVYSNDPTWNCFPSTHCATALLAGLALLRDNRWHGIWGVGCALAIGVSTLLTKQHYVADVAAGYALALAGHHVFLRMRILDRVEDVDAGTVMARLRGLVTRRR